MILAQVFKNHENLNSKELANRTFAGFHFDSRLIQANQIFWAIKTDKNDGHHYVEQALNEKKACAAVVSYQFYQNCSQELRGSLIPMSDTIENMSIYAKEFLQSFNIKHKIAITGTNGKTTTKEILFSILKQSLNTVKSNKNFNNKIGLIYNIMNLDPQVFTNNQIDVAVFELGTNHPGEIKELAEIYQCDIAIITNVAQGHLEHFGSVQNIAKEKLSLINSTKKKPIAFLNADCDTLFTEGLKSDNQIYWLTTGNLTLKAKKRLNQIQYKKLNNGIVLNHSIYQTATDYYPFVENLAISIAVAKHLKIEDNKINPGIEKVVNEPHRMDIKKNKELIVIDDCYNSNPNSMRFLIDVATKMSTKEHKKIIFIIGDMLELGNSQVKEHKNIGYYLDTIKNKIDWVFTCGKLSENITRELNLRGFHRSAFFTNKEDLWKNLVSHSLNQKIICIKGSRGMKMEFFVDKLMSLKLTA